MVPFPKRQSLVVILLNGLTYRLAVDARDHASAPEIVSQFLAEKGVKDGSGKLNLLIQSLPKT